MESRDRQVEVDVEIDCSCCHNTSYRFDCMHCHLTGKQLEKQWVWQTEYYPVGKRPCTSCGSRGRIRSNCQCCESRGWRLLADVEREERKARINRLLGGIAIGLVCVTAIALFYYFPAQMTTLAVIGWLIDL
ncbi:MAG: hypothetical protein JNJ83_13990 [Verrucomicrobiaceae bacterium]|nr:hypothetical protein [Verrucomicrobiaceae bacterium]